MIASRIVGLCYRAPDLRGFSREYGDHRSEEEWIELGLELLGDGYEVYVIEHVEQLTELSKLLDARSKGE